MVLNHMAKLGLKLLDRKNKYCFEQQAEKYLQDDMEIWNHSLAELFISTFHSKEGYAKYWFGLKAFGVHF